MGDLGCCLAGRDVGWTLGNTLSFKGLVLKLRAAEVYLMYHGSHFFHIIYKNMYTSMRIHINCIDVPVVYHIISLFQTAVQGKAAGFDCVTKPREAGKARIAASVCKHLWLRNSIKPSDAVLLDD